MNRQTAPTPADPPAAPSSERRVLLLAGTAEAREIALALSRKRDIYAVASLAGATRQSRPLALPTRIGGFGGEEGQEKFLREQAITHVIDATHPFASRISHRSAALCARLGLPYLQVLRPGWTPVEGDRWTMIDREEDAAGLISPGTTVFLATGRQTLDSFANLSECKLYCRQIDPPEGPFPFPNGAFLVGKPPFPVGDEMALFKRLRIDWLVVKDAGGEASATKLIAARRLGVPVLIIRRPEQPQAERVETAAEAMAWLGF